MSHKNSRQQTKSVYIPFIARKATYVEPLFMPDIKFKKIEIKGSSQPDQSAHSSDFLFKDKQLIAKKISKLVTPASAASLTIRDLYLNKIHDLITLNTSIEKNEGKIADINNKIDQFCVRALIPWITPRPTISNIKEYASFVDSSNYASTNKSWVIWIQPIVAFDNALTEREILEKMKPAKMIAISHSNSAFAILFKK